MTREAEEGPIEPFPLARNCSGRDWFRRFLAALTPPNRRARREGRPRYPPPLHDSAGKCWGGTGGGPNNDHPSTDGPSRSTYPRAEPVLKALLTSIK